MLEKYTSANILSLALAQRMKQSTKAKVSNISEYVYINVKKSGISYKNLWN